MQRSPSPPILHIHIRASNQELFYCFNVSTSSSAIYYPVLAAVFAEEVGDFGFAVVPGVVIKRRFAIIILRIHIGTVGDK